MKARGTLHPLHKKKKERGPDVDRCWWNDERVPFDGFTFSLRDEVKSSTVRNERPRQAEHESVRREKKSIKQLFY